MNIQFTKVIICIYLLMFSHQFTATTDKIGLQSRFFLFDSTQFENQINEQLIKYYIPGAAVAIINRDSIWIRTYGYSNLRKKKNISPKTIFRLGSISKSYLAIAIMQLVNERKMNLNDKVTNILPEIEFNNEYEETDPVKIIHLLEHTSSIDDVHFNEGYNEPGVLYLPLNEIFSINPKSRFVRWRPGDFTSYSNDAFSILALIIERITNQKFEEYIQENISNKIGAESTTYNRTKNNDSLFAQGYTNNGIPLGYVQVLMRPSGGINSNIGDMAKFVQMILNKGSYKDNSIIDSLTLLRMFYPSSSIPAREGFKPGYGAGFSSFFINGQKFIGHGGGLPDFKSIFLFNTDLNIGIVVLTNSNSDNFGRFVNKVVSSLELDDDNPHEYIEYSTNKFITNDIVGYYSQANYGISLDRFPNYFLTGQTIIFENDTLYIEEFQSEKKVLIHLKGNAYKRINEISASVYFFRNLEEEMMLTNLGKDFYRKDSAEWAIFDRIFLLFSLIITTSFLIFSSIWIFKRLILKLIKRKVKDYQVLPRLFPLFAILSLFVSLISLSLWFSDYINAGKITLMSLNVTIFSLLFPLLSLISFWVCCFRKDSKIKSKVEKVYLFVVTSTLIGLSLFLYYYEIIGLKLWAY